MGFPGRRKINILEMISSFGYAGAQRNLVTFCKMFNRDFFSVFAAAYHAGGIQEKVLSGLGVDYIVAEGDSQKIIDFIKNKNIHVVHIHRSGKYSPYETQIIAGIKRINPDIIIIENNIFGQYDPASEQHIDCHFFQSMMHVNERYLPASGEEYNEEKHKVLYNMVDSQTFSHYALSVDQIGQYKRELGIDPKDFVIGKIARPNVAKWSDLILDMMPHLIKVLPNVRFVIVGVPKSRVSRIRSGPFSKYFILLDETVDESVVHRFYQIIDVLAHSSKIGECNGNTINEAMYWKRPVVVNSTPRKDNGQLEQIAHMQDGIIANFPQTYARALAYLYAHPGKRREMGEAGYEKIMRICDPRTIVLQIEKKIVESLSSKGVVLSNDILDTYVSIRYSPTADEIIRYKSIYPTLLGQEFGVMSITERLEYWSRAPFRFTRRVEDFIEHKELFS